MPSAEAFLMDQELQVYHLILLSWDIKHFQAWQYPKGWELKFWKTMKEIVCDAKELVNRAILHDIFYIMYGVLKGSMFKN